MDDHVETAYTANLLIGTPEQTIPVIFDTASHLTVIEGYDGATAPAYDPASSSSDTSTGVTFQESYYTNKLSSVRYSGDATGSSGQEITETAFCLSVNTECATSGIKFNVAGTVNNNPYTQVGGYVGLAYGKGANLSGVTPSDADMLLP